MIGALFMVLVAWLLSSVGHMLLGLFSTLWSTTLPFGQLLVDGIGYMPEINYSEASDVSPVSPYRF